MYTYYSIFSAFAFLAELKLTLMMHCPESTQPKNVSLGLFLPCFKFLSSFRLVFL